MDEQFNNISGVSPANIKYTLSYLSGKNILLNDISYVYLSKTYTKTFDSRIPINNTFLNEIINGLIVQDTSAIDTLLSKGITVDFASPTNVSIDSGSSVSITSCKSVVSNLDEPFSSISITYLDSLPTRNFGNSSTVK